MIQPNDIKDTARNACLSITKEEEEKFREDLSRVFQWVAQLEKVCLQAIPTPNRRGCPLVPDIAEKCPLPEVLLKESSDTKNNFFVVPRSIEDLS